MKALKNKNYIMGFIILILSITILTVLVVTNTKGTSYIPLLKVEGDVSNAYIVKSLEEFENTTIEHKDKKYSCIKLGDIIKKAKPLFEQGAVRIIGEDGFTSEIPSNNLQECYISFSVENGWEAINLDYPISTNAKRLKSILLVSQDKFPENSIGIITPEANVANLTVGNILAGSFESYPYFEGRAFVTKNNVQNSSDVYTRHIVVKLSKIIDMKDGDQVLVTERNGESTRVDGGGYLEVKNNAINYTLFDKEHEIKNIAGIMVAPPSKSVTNVPKDVLNSIKSGKKAMVIYVDGFGYHQYKSAVENGYAPYLKTLSNVKPAYTVYIPVTNAGFAAMITGKTPDENGVHSRKERNMNVATIFDKLQEQGKKALLIEGNIKILNTKVDTILNVDKNNNKSTDDEVFETADKNMDKGWDFMLVHFHGVDDTGHQFGDLSEKTMSKIKEVDAYIKKLSSKWNGDIIITADHGMHAVGNAGNHGDFLYQDMIVPYIMSKGGK
jgi:hypothetical protein